MSREHRYLPGKVDYNRSGRKNCLTEITWELKDGRFAMAGGIWNPRETDYYCCGQVVDEVARYFPDDAKLQRMLAVWREWHLNNMKAGTPAQEAFLKTRTYPRSGDYLTWACETLRAAGLEPDQHEGKPYRYGSAWLKAELPPEIVAEIESWSK